MRIFQVLEDTSNPAVPGSRTWYRNLYEPLIEQGHDVVLFSATPGRLAMRCDDARGRTLFSEQLLQAFATEHARRPFDLFFAYLMDGMIDPAVIDEVRRTSVPTCNFSCNNAHQFELVDELAPHFDLNLHSEKDVAQKFRSVGATPFWWPMASNPRYWKPLDVERTTEVSFVGANYALRARYCSHLLHNGVDVHVYGPGWKWGTTSRWRGIAKRAKRWAIAGTAWDKSQRLRASMELAELDFGASLADRFPGHVHDPVSDHELIALYSRSVISLGFLEVYGGHDPSRPAIRHLHLREFEAPMSGALYCTGYMDELAEMFEPDVEVLVYRNQYELLDKVKYYLSHSADAELVRAAGRARALRDHTYHRRFAQLFAHMGLA